MSRIVDSGADMTMFGQLTKIQKKSITINNQLLQQIQQLNEMTTDFVEMQKQAKVTGTQTRTKLLEQTKKLEQKIRNYLSLQKIQNQRFAGQISEMSLQDKQIGSQLDFLQARLQDFEKNVYGSKRK